MLIVVLSFVAIAAMRVVQKVCGKQVSNSVKSGEMFFRYGAFYQFVAAAFSLITLAITGFYGFNLPTVLCAFISALLFAVDLFTGIEVLKGCSMTVATMFGLGGLIISCVLSIFLFNEPMSVFQAIGLAFFFVGVYLLTPSKAEKSQKISLKTYILLIISLLTNGFVMVAQKYFSALGEGKLTFMDYAKTEYSVATYSFLTFILNATMMFVCAIVLYAKRKAQEKSVAAQTEIELPAATETEAQAALAAAECAKTECAEAEQNPQTQKTEQKTSKGVLFGLTKTHLICGSLLALAVFVINYLVTELGKTVPSVILFPISSAISIGLSALVGWVMYKEKLTTRNFIGLFVGLLGIIVIGLLTPATVAKWF